MVWLMFSYAPRVCSLFEADEAKTMMQGVGSRFDFHMHKTLCDLRYVSGSSCSADSFTSYVVRAKYSTSSSISQTPPVLFRTSR